MLYRFHIELSDIDRGVYESLDFRLAQHPSETPTYLLSRALAYILSFEIGLDFSAGGLADPESPAMSIPDARGGTDLWIEIGNPSTRKLHKATKTSRRVTIYTYKNAEALAAQIQIDNVHRGSEIRIFALDSKFLTELETKLEKSNRWSILNQDGRLDIDIGGSSTSTEVREFGD